MISIFSVSKEQGGVKSIYWKRLINTNASIVPNIKVSFCEKKERTKNNYTDIENQKL